MLSEDAPDRARPSRRTPSPPTYFDPLHQDREMFRIRHRRVPSLDLPKLTRILPRRHSERGPAERSANDSSHLLFSADNVGYAGDHTLNPHLNQTDTGLHTLTMSSKSLDPEVVNRLLMAKQMLASSSPHLTPTSDPVVVAQTILLTHDSAELASAALAAHVGAKTEKQNMGLTNYIDAIESKCATAFPGKLFFSTLNEARRSFKHHGIVPNSQEFHQVLEHARDYLDQAAHKFLGCGLETIDLLSLVQSNVVRDYLVDARSHKKAQRFSAG